MERSIGYVCHSFFVPCVSRYRHEGQALDLEGLNLEFDRWLTLTANARRHSTTHAVPAERLDDERASLQPLPPTRLAGSTRLARREGRSLRTSFSTERLQHPLSVMTRCWRRCERTGRTDPGRLSCAVIGRCRRALPGTGANAAEREHSYVDFLEQCLKASRTNGVDAHRRCWPSSPASLRSSSSPITRGFRAWTSTHCPSYRTFTWQYPKRCWRGNTHFSPELGRNSRGSDGRRRAPTTISRFGDLGIASLRNDEESRPVRRASAIVRARRRSESSLTRGFH